eukprot:10128778-Lingulodinium_polyedra.AAC.1
MTDIDPSVQVHSSLQTSENLYQQLTGPTNSPLGILQARSFYEELFQPDDLPRSPKDLLAEMIHRYTLLAAGLP